MCFGPHINAWWAVCDPKAADYTYTYRTAILAHKISRISLTNQFPSHMSKCGIVKSIMRAQWKRACDPCYGKHPVYVHNPSWLHNGPELTVDSQWMRVFRATPYPVHKSAGNICPGHRPLHTGQAEGPGAASDPHARARQWPSKVTTQHPGTTVTNNNINAAL